MRKSTLVALAVVASLLAFGSIVQDFRLHHSLADERTTSLAVNNQIGTLEVALSDFRAAQTGYLATGQGPDFWMRRATDLSGQMGSGLDELRGETTSADARASYDAASAALSDLESIDKRARDSIQGDQRFVASDLIFVDGLEASQRFVTALAAAKTSEAKTADATFLGTSRWRLGMNASAVLIALVALLLATLVTPAAAASEASVVAQMIRDLPPAVKPAGALVAAKAATAPPPLPVPVPVPVVNLADTADLCVDLARVIDDRDIPALLDRTRESARSQGRHRVGGQQGGLNASSDPDARVLGQGHRQARDPRRGGRQRDVLVVPLDAAADDERRDARFGRRDRRSTRDDRRVFRCPLGRSAGRQTDAGRHRAGENHRGAVRDIDRA